VSAALSSLLCNCIEHEAQGWWDHPEREREQNNFQPTQDRTHTFFFFTTNVAISGFKQNFVIFYENLELLVRKHMHLQNIVVKVIVVSFHRCIKQNKQKNGVAVP